MSWQPVMEYEEVVPVRVRSTRKKIWNNTTNTWRDVTMWTMDYEQEILVWLEKHYPDRAGWGSIGDRKILMEEPVYLHYCLVKKS